MRQRQHPCAAGEVDLGSLVTHRYRLDDWRAASLTAIRTETGCIKVAIGFPDAIPA